MTSTEPQPAAKPDSTAIPVQLSAAEFAQFILPHLSLPKRGPQCKIGYHNPFNYILKVLYTGMQWKELPIDKLLAYLRQHQHRLHYGAQRRAGYPLSSGGIESANKFICHTRLKRSGAWWYVANSNHMLALRCAKYNGTFERVFDRYRQTLLAKSQQKNVKK